MTPRTDLLQGTLDVLVLKTLVAAPMHGWGISQRIQQLSEDVLQVNQGSLYPALYRLEAKGWIRSEWIASENNRRARFYELTRAGRKQLGSERRAGAFRAGRVPRSRGRLGRPVGEEEAMTTRVMTALRNLRRRGAVESQLDEEMRFHLEAETRKSLSRAACRPRRPAGSALAFGGVEVQGGVPRRDGGAHDRDAAQDVRYGVRGLKRNPVSSRPPRS
jgi:transcriptional regulator